MEKSSEAFRTISEVASELDVPKHVLRFWEGRFPQIRPMKRGGGRRYYRPDDVEFLKGVRRLLYEEGYTIKGVQKVIRDLGADFVKGCWQQLGRSPGGRSTRGVPRAVAEGAKAATDPLAQARPNGTATPLRLSRKQARVLQDILGELEACRRTLAQARD